MAIEERQDSTAQGAPAMPAGVLRWQPWVCRMRRWGRISQGGSKGIALRLATPAFLAGLMRRHALPAEMVRRVENAWPSCAMDWRALAPRLAARSADAVAAGRSAGGGAGVPVRPPVQWHTVEHIVVREAGVAAVAVTPEAPQMSMMFPRRAQELPSAATPTPGYAQRASDAATSARHLDGTPADAADATSPVPVSSVPSIHYRGIMTTGLRPPEYPERSSRSPAMAMPAAADHHSPVSASLPSQKASGTGYPPMMLPLPASEKIAAGLSPIAVAVPQAGATRDKVFVAHSLPEMSLPLAAILGRDGHAGVPEESSMPAFQSRPAQTLADPAPVPPEQSLGDRLYDQAMQDLHYAAPRGRTAATPPAPTVQPMQSTPSSAAQAGRWEPAQPAPRIGRDDIEQVAARVMRIIRREQRREREAKGVF